MSSTKRQDRISGPVFSLYRCLLNLGYAVKSCKKTGNSFRILLIHNSDNDNAGCGHSRPDKIIRLYPRGVFDRDG